MEKTMTRLEVERLLTMKEVMTKLEIKELVSRKRCNWFIAASVFATFAFYAGYILSIFEKPL